jgi:ribonuclease HI
MKKDIGMGLVFVSSLGVWMRYMVRLHFPASNNVAEYEALINGLCITVELGIRWLDVRGNSQLVIDQVMKESSYHSAKVAAYCQEVCQLEDKFDGLELNHIPRWLNEAANKLAKMASNQEPAPTGIFASNQYKPFVCYEESEQSDYRPPALGSGADRPSAPSDLKVMELDKDLVAKLDPPTE